MLLKVTTMLGNPAFARLIACLIDRPLAFITNHKNLFLLHLSEHMNTNAPSRDKSLQPPNSSRANLRLHLANLSSLHAKCQVWFSKSLSFHDWIRKGRFFGPWSMRSFRTSVELWSKHQTNWQFPFALRSILRLARKDSFCINHYTTETNLTKTTNTKLIRIQQTSLSVKARPICWPKRVQQRLLCITRSGT